MSSHACRRGCGKDVSDNKEFCSDCQGKTPTHILLHWETDDIDNLYRADNGVFLGGREGVTVIFGEDPKQRTARVFLDGIHADRYLRQTVAGPDAVVETRMG